MTDVGEGWEKVEKKTQVSQGKAEDLKNL